MNSYNYSYNVLINRLEAFAAGHLLIKRFTHGQIDLADMDQDEQYPFMHVVPNNIKPVDGGMQFDFQIIFADIPRDKETKAEYQREVISDCVRLAQDLIAEVKNGLQLFGFDVQLVTPPVIEPFMEEYKNTLTGVTFSLQLEVPWDWSACDIPAVWAVGGSSSGGSGSGIGLTLRVNGVDNAVQNILDLVAGTNITITDNGDGSVTFDAAGGGGGGGGPYVSTEYNANHTTAQGNQYVVGDRVWYNGSVYACIANNDGINPTNPTYWTLQAVGYRLRQTPVDWNATTGDYQILNKPVLQLVATTGDYNDLVNTPSIPNGLQDVITLDNVLTQANSIDCNTNDLSIDDTPNFEVNSTSKLNLNVNAVSEIALDSSSVGIIQSSGANVQQVLVDTNKVIIQSGLAATGLTSIASEPNAVKIITPAVHAATATVGQVLALSNVASGQVEFVNAPSTSGFVPYTGATQDVDLDANKLSAESIYIEGTNGNGHLHLKHQNADATATGQSTSLWANNDGDIKWKNDNDYKTTLKTSANTADRVYTFPDEDCTLMPRNAAITGATKTKITYDADGLITSGADIVAADISNSTTVGQGLITLPNPSAIRYLRINADNTVSALTLAELKSDLAISTAFLAATFTTVGTGFESVTDLSFAVTANKTYKWRATIAFTATSGSTFSLTGPASPTFNVYRFTASNAATTNTVFNAGAYDIGTNAAMSSNGICTADGVIRPTANGTVTVRVRSASGGGLSLRAGSIIEFEEVL